MESSCEMAENGDVLHSTVDNSKNVLIQWMTQGDEAQHLWAGNLLGSGRAGIQNTLVLLHLLNHVLNKGRINWPDALWLALLSASFSLKWTSVHICLPAYPFNSISSLQLFPGWTSDTVMGMRRWVSEDWDWTSWVLCLWNKWQQTSIQQASHPLHWSQWGAGN